MTPFTALSAPAVALNRTNVDTDQILPARFLRKPRSAGYQNFLFADLRDDPDFAFARAGGGVASIVADSNFGCGSSREGAVYALVDAGVRCVVAPSFGDIFAGNAAKNGLLTIVLPADECAALRNAMGGGGTLTVDLPNERLQGPNGTWQHFAIDPFRKRCLVEGLDDIGLTLAHAEAIGAWCLRDGTERPWVTPT